MLKIFFILITSFFFLKAESMDDYKNLIETKFLALKDIKKNKASLYEGNLKVGQSGIILHTYENGNKIVIKNAKIISSNDNSSQVEFFNFDDIKQNNLPNTKRTVSENDIFILNYLYDKSMIIAPSQETFLSVRKTFFKNSFLHSDIFASKLKVMDKPYPYKKDIMDFAINQNLGTIFIIANKKVYILDSQTFKKLASFNIDYKIDKKTKMPFYTRVEDIKEGVFSFSKDETYEEHYKEVLGLK